MEYFHVLDRGVEKRDIVIDDSDRLRFVHDLYVMNDRARVAHPKEIQRTRKRDVLVNIHAWCLMNNHYHLLLSPIDDDVDNLSLFMQKLNMGFGKYFNEKYKRTGRLWQGVYKKIHVTRDAHFLYIPFYIHLNPLDYTHPEWRDGAVQHPKDALRKLREYRWSSLLDYTEAKNFPSIICSNGLAKILGSKKAQERRMIQIISNLDMPNASHLLK